MFHYSTIGKDSSVTRKTVYFNRLTVETLSIAERQRFSHQLPSYLSFIVSKICMHSILSCLTGITGSVQRGSIRPSSVPSGLKWESP